MVSSELQQDIRNALSILDPGNDEHWTQAGLPSVEVIKDLVGKDGVNRSAIDAVASGFDRENQVLEADDQPDVAEGNDQPGDGVGDDQADDEPVAEGADSQEPPADAPADEPADAVGPTADGGGDDDVEADMAKAAGDPNPVMRDVKAENKEKAKALQARIDDLDAEVARAEQAAAEQMQFADRARRELVKVRGDLVKLQPPASREEQLQAYFASQDAMAEQIRTQSALDAAFAARPKLGGTPPNYPAPPGMARPDAK